jgi:hypothetical protein
MSFKSCCGQISGKTSRRPAPEKLPDNPHVAGIPVVYVGAGRRDVKGQASGLTYYVADHRRHFRAHPDDIKALLRSRDFILQT